ncbi:hypothetical protein GCM10010384_61240 [Streptomyces djakartensis]|uniref:Uncharacterized protein n=1 Tax=Streptomyces djakartensis TaxID=68193 RepID=A0ABQ3AGH3_9ACTN|nr:hypothetical protein GCM10010384_61240 [Streptomyces djakartensis]
MRPATGGGIRTEGARVHLALEGTRGSAIPHLVDITDITLLTHQLTL